MFKDWNIVKQTSFNRSFNKIDWLINLVTDIRSTKVNLNVSPGSFVDISISELSADKKSTINHNIALFKRLGRVNSVSLSKIDKNGIKIIVDGETVTLYFDQNVDLNEQRQIISDKTKVLGEKVAKINHKLKNKSFLKNAPKQVVEKEKTSLKDYNIELKKLNSILNSIKD